MKPVKVISRELADQGLTLIELVVAMSVFALIAVMGLQSLNGSLRIRDRLAGIADTAETLGQGAGLLRHDVQSAVPMLFYPAGRGQPRSAVQALGQGFSLSIATRNETGAPLGRVDWRFDKASGTLMRRRWPTLYPASDDQASPEVAAWPGVTALRLRSYWQGVGWVDGVGKPETLSGQQVNLDEDGGGAVIESYSDGLPLGLEITVVTRDHGDVLLLESLK